MTNDFDPAELRAAMRRWLAQPGNSQAELSRLTGVPRPTVIATLTGKIAQPGLNNVLAIGRVVGFAIGQPSQGKGQAVSLETGAAIRDDAPRNAPEPPELSEEVLAAQMMIQLLREIRNDMKAVRHHLERQAEADRPGEEPREAATPDRRRKRQQSSNG